MGRFRLELEYYLDSTSLFKVFYSYAGLSNANNVMNEVKNPVRTLRSVSLAALITSCLLYILANVAYFLVVPLDEIKRSNELVAALFFERAFGPSWGRTFLPLMIAISAAANVMVVTFALVSDLSFRYEHSSNQLYRLESIKKLPDRDFYLLQE